MQTSLLNVFRTSFPSTQQPNRCSSPFITPFSQKNNFAFSLKQQSPFFGSNSLLLKNYSTTTPATTKPKKPSGTTKLTKRPHIIQISKAKIIRDRVHTWLKDLRVKADVDDEVAFLREMYLKRLEWHRRLVEREEKKRFKVYERKKFDKRMSVMEAKMEENRQIRAGIREEIFKSKEEAYAKGKEEFLRALTEDQDLWSDYPDELQDKKYILVREQRPYFTRYN